MDLFRHTRQKQIEQEAPLAHRMRPRTLDEYVGQEHIMGEGRLLRRAIQADQLSSLIFYGPPGTGKTTLAKVISQTTKSHFITINAVLAGVKQIREAIETAQEQRTLYNTRTTLFVDEVHRWNKAQQDALLPHVENGTIILIGATTENPYFEVNKALVSRSRIFQLQPLTPDDLRQIAQNALNHPERGYGKQAVQMDEDALNHIVDVANGDARGVLNALELAIETTPINEAGEIHVTLAVAEESIQQRAVLYDKDGDTHYDTISAFIKSLRGSDPDAALYWMAKMVYAGEDPRFIFRRMTIVASEDVGLADPNAVAVVTSCWESFERIGMPEGRYPLAQAALYLATCPKSNSTMAFFDALAMVEQEQDSDVPNHLKDNNRDSEGFGHGKGYLYPHAYRDHWVAQQYLPSTLQGRMFYEPSDQGYEAQVQIDVARRREEQLTAMMETAVPTPIYSTSPADQGKDRWLARTLGDSGANLAQVRQHLFDGVGVARHERLLDLQVGSGLLLWEAVRQTPEGGVWGLGSEADVTALTQWADRLPELDRPQLQVGSWQQLPSLIADGLQFEVVLGRNLLTTAGDQAQMLGQRVREVLANNGRLALAQTIPRHTQRIYQLLNMPDLPSLASAEEAIYHNPDDPLVNWDETTLIVGLQTAGLTVQHQLLTLTEQKRISPTLLDRWFGEAGTNGRLSYAQHLQTYGLSIEEVAQVETHARRRLLNKTVAWRTAVLLIFATA